MAPKPLRSRGGPWGWIGYVLLAAVVTLVGQKLATLFGPVLLIYTIAAIAFAVLYAAISFRSLLVPFLVLILSVGLLRFVWAVQAPILPDLFIDRISLIWLTLIFMSLAIYRRIPLRKPFTLDILLVIHATYIMIRVLTTNPLNFAQWAASVATPYAVFFFAKNIVRTRRQIHLVLVIMGVLSAYYMVTSIAEKFHIDWLLFPRMMAEPHPRAAGRSSGPFRAPGMFGDTMGMVLPVFLYFIVQARRRISKILYGLALLLGLVGVLFTYTRGSMLATALGIGVVVSLNRKAYLRYILPVLIVAPLLLIKVVNVQEDEFLQDRLEATNPIESRAGNLVTGLRMWRHYPLFGCGSYMYMENAVDFVAPVELPILGIAHVNQFRGSPAHDMYIAPLAEDGAVGALLQIMIHIMILRVSFLKLGLRRRNDYFATYILPIFFGIYAIYFFGGLIISFRHFAILGSLYYMAAGITYGYTPEEAEDSPEERKLT